MPWYEAIVWAGLGGMVAEAVPTLRLYRRDREEARRLTMEEGGLKVSIGLALVGAIVGFAQYRTGVVSTAVAVLQVSAVGPALVERWIGRDRNDPGKHDPPVVDS